MNQLGDGADRFLDGHCGIEPGRTVDVQVVGADPAQRVGQEVLDGDRAGVHAVPATGGIPQDAELDADRHLVPAAPAQRVAEEQLVVPHAVEVAGVEQGHARVEGGMDRGHALGVVRRPVQVGHAHQAKSHRGHLGTCRTQRTKVSQGRVHGAHCTELD
jgi:hypothetical protein